ncbi:hypothetical protein TWF696_006746 [Orbilia brochopaga]|uniref:Uncharacterized protein n=1 Tax=Orbilia brochopaga TaxID=3140254 RepID=A0AAV9UW06_9PEZI
MHSPLTVATFRRKLLEVLKGEEEDVTVEFENVSPEVAKQCDELLSEGSLRGRRFRFFYNASSCTLRVFAMPSKLHECFSDAMFRSFAHWTPLLPPSWEEDLQLEPSIRIGEFEAPYAGSEKEPDWSVSPTEAAFPSVVLEVGVSEAYSQLLVDKDVWLIGSGGATKVVILVKVRRLGSSTAAFMEIWRQGQDSARRVTILPALEDSEELEEDPYILLKDLYGDEPVPAGFGPNTRLPITLSSLRLSVDKATRGMAAVDRRVEARREAARLRV